MTYGVDENVVGQTANHASGTTNGIAGDLAIDANDPSSSRVGKIVINLEQLHSDNNLRDATIRKSYLASEANPLATFTTTSVTGLPASLTEGKTYHFTLNGDLTVKGVTAPASWAGHRLGPGRQAHGHRHHHGQDVHLRHRADQPGRLREHQRPGVAHLQAGGARPLQVHRARPDRGAGLGSPGFGHRSLVQDGGGADPGRQLRLVPRRRARWARPTGSWPPQPTPPRWPTGCES